MAKPYILGTFGEMDSGKTYNIEKMINLSKRTKIVYNYGNENDWVDYEEIELKAVKEELYFIYKKKRFLFKTAFMKKFKGKKVKIESLFDQKPLNLFYIEVAKMKTDVKYGYLMIEDATGVFNVNLTKIEKFLFSRCKHSDMRLILTSHDLHYFPKQLWGLLTHVRLFRTTNPPPKEKRAEIPCYEALLEAWEVLQDAPRFSYYTLDVKKKTLTYTRYKEL